MKEAFESRKTNHKARCPRPGKLQPLAVSGLGSPPFPGLAALEAGVPYSYCQAPVWGSRS